MERRPVSRLLRLGAASKNNRMSVSDESIFPDGLLLVVLEHRTPHTDAVPIVTQAEILSFSFKGLNRINAVTDGEFHVTRFGVSGARS